MDFVKLWKKQKSQKKKNCLACIKNVQRFGRRWLNGGLLREQTAAGQLPWAQRKEVGQPGGSVSRSPPGAQQGESGAHPDGLQRSTQQVQPTYAYRGSPLARRGHARAGPTNQSEPLCCASVPAPEQNLLVMQHSRRRQPKTPMAQLEGLWSVFLSAITRDPEPRGINPPV